MPTIHEPVMLREILEMLKPQSGQNFIDCTFGGGGHSLAILESVKPNGKVLGIDWDNLNIRNSCNDNLILVNSSYVFIKEVYQKIKDKYDFNEISGILLDLGLSSDQLEDSSRGFSFNSTGDLDMRFDKSSLNSTASDILSSYSQKQLENIFKEYGEEPLAKEIAKNLIRAREEGEDLQSAVVLVRLIEDVYRRRYKIPSRKNPATKVFQALRIEVNKEFDNIKKVLPQAIDLLKVGGRLAVITFHSGEDRLVKDFFKKVSLIEDPKIKVVNKKPIIPGDDEIKNNPRSRSAKLRIIEKIRK